MKAFIAFVIAVLLLSTASAYLGRVYYDDGNMIVTVINHDKPTLKDAKIRVNMPTLGTASSTDMLTVKADSSKKARVLLDLEDVEPDYYPVIVTIQNRGRKEVRHTWIYIE